jgi:hypothetical protein
VSRLGSFKVLSGIAPVVLSYAPHPRCPIFQSAGDAADRAWQVARQNESGAFAPSIAAVLRSMYGLTVATRFPTPASGWSG